jgi:LmbE family N-acetylglucosaminyl deacetylase
MGMREELVFGSDDSIAVIAPHPDDESLCAAAALIMAPEITDVYVISDGSHGNAQRSIEEEAVVRKRQFDAEMDYVKPRRHVWLGYEDTKLAEHFEAADEIDFTRYTKVFLPWNQSTHPDHRACAHMCCEAIVRQKASADCYMYELNATFYKPTHFCDLTGAIEEKRKLIAFHEDQVGHEEIAITLNRFRGAQLLSRPSVEYAESYLKVDPLSIIQEM